MMKIVFSCSSCTHFPQSPLAILRGKKEPCNSSRDSIIYFSIKGKLSVDKELWCDVLSPVGIIIRELVSCFFLGMW